MTPRPQLLPIKNRIVYAIGPGVESLRFCGGPATVLDAYRLILLRLGFNCTPPELPLGGPGVASHKATTDTILLFLTPEVIVSQ